MTNASPTNTRRAANVMLALGIVAMLVAMVIGGFAIFALPNSRDAGGDWGGLTSLTARPASAHSPKTETTAPNSHSLPPDR